MNKHKFKLLFALFSFFVGAFFVACNYDDSSREYHDEDGNKAHFKKEKVSFEIFSKNKNLFSKLNTDKETLTAKSANKIVSASDNSFFINTNSATYIENENGLHSYTFYINRNLENVLLENLVISLQEDGTYKSFIVTYNITQPEFENLKNGLFVDMDNKMSIEIFNDDNFLSQLSNKIVYSPCITGTTEYWKCSNNVSGHRPGVPGYPNCIADTFEYVINVEYGLCATDDGEVIGTGDTGGSNGGGGGSSDSNDSTYDGSDTSIHGNGGVDTAPTLNEDNSMQDPPTPCDELNKLTEKKNYPTHPYMDSNDKRIRNAIINMGSEFSASTEKGYAFFNMGNYLEYGPFAKYTNPSGDNHVHFPGFAYQFGTIHTHPTSGYFPMFSHDDIYTLLSIADTYNSGFYSSYNTSGNNLFVSVLVVNIDGVIYTYAIKIDDINKLGKLRDVHPNNNGSPRKWSKFANSLSYYYEEYANGYNGSKLDYEKTFLTFLKNKDLGVSLYEMNQTGFGTPSVTETWSKLELNSDNSNVVSTPCE
ncbi:hypothetical protein [Flavobacterium okayamense]|uniref:DUF4329 domain-containing protein n=1 Tax=Flavobacterium okayamense TaxID=2830782 RepID=A0ABN6HU29_9FLAO|nr:hypothetical protein [Flavobacterium okayamense]BCY28019.1 hypothetical protein KK2020170_08870 [Flavobacterium okayamense]